MMVGSISALCSTEQRAGVLWCCPERYKIESAVAHDGKNTALGAGHLLLPWGLELMEASCKETS